MPDIRVVAVITGKPESAAIVGAAMRDLVEPTRAEAGCRSYELYESSAAPGTFITVESWRDAADLDTHMATPHIAAALAAVGDHLATAPAIHPLRPIDVRG